MRPHPSSGPVLHPWRRVSAVVATVTILFAALVGASACASVGSHPAASEVSQAGSAVTAVADGSAGEAGDTLANETERLVSPAETVTSKVSASVVNVRVEGVTANSVFGQQQYEGVGSGIVYTSDG